MACPLLNTPHIVMQFSRLLLRILEENMDEGMMLSSAFDSCKWGKSK
jgi:hypothetical protein